MPINKAGAHTHAHAVRAPDRVYHHVGNLRATYPRTSEGTYHRLSYVFGDTTRPSGATRVNYGHGRKEEVVSGRVEEIVEIVRARIR